MKAKISRFFLIVVMLTTAMPSHAQIDSRGFELADGFDPNFIISDDDLFDAESMNRDRLIDFLRIKGSLGDHMVADIDGTTKLAADIIMRVAASYKISPKFILALMQREQSLVEDPDPSQDQLDWAMGFGVCDACSKDDPAISDFKGFANQVEYASRQMREKYYIRYLTYGRLYGGITPGETTTIDGISVTPVNFATAALYTYTPHIHGNMNMWQIWTRWFNKSYPNGTVVIGDPSGTIYWIRYGTKRPFASVAVASTLTDIEKAVTASDAELAGYETGEPIRFPNYALLRNSTGQIWLIVDDERRHIVNMDTFVKFGFNMDEVEDVADSELASYGEGMKITLDDAYPRGQLIQVSGLKAIWYAEGGKRQLITHPAIWTLYFNNRRPSAISQATLDSLTHSGAYLLHDGELVKSYDHPAVYVIENGMKRPIVSGEVFEEMGYGWEYIESLPSSLIDEYTTGLPIQIDAPAPSPEPSL